MKIENKTILAATVSPKDVTLYCEEGDVIVLPSNEQFTKDVLDYITPALANNEKIVLNMEAKRLDIFEKVEQKTNGLVKFFRVAKKAIGMGGDTPMTEEFVRSIALPIEGYKLENKAETIVAIVETPEPEAETGQTATEAKSQADEPVCAAAIAASSVGASVAQGDRTAVEVSAVKPKPTPATKAIIPGAERLVTQIKHFSEQDNPEGFAKFMQRIGSVISHRSHSIDELLDFLSKADLPIADDGTIIAYKRLNSNSDGTLRDTHSGLVKQRVGSRVFMEHTLVDPNRRNECSNGLHIGRRDYMSNFNGDTIIICKIHPEDVIAVPTDYGASKMRCAGYDIIAKVPQKGFGLLISNRPMTDDPECAKLLGAIIAGNHAPVTQHVKITGNRGTGLVITDLNKTAKAVEAPVEAPKAEPEQKKAEPSLKAAKAPAKPKKANKPQKALAKVDTLNAAKIDPEVNSPKAIKEKAKAVAKKAPTNEMTKEQKEAKKLWAKVKSGEMSKVALAKQCKTSTRSLERWAEKFKF